MLMFRAFGRHGPQNRPSWRGHPTVISGRGFPEGSWSQEAPRMPQDGPEEAKIAPSWPKMGPKIAPRWGKLGQDCPRLLQNCSKKAPKTVKMDKDVAFALPLRFLCFSFAAEWGCSRSYPSLLFGEYNSNSNSLCTPLV